METYKNILFLKEKNYYKIEINRPNNLNALNQNTIEELSLLKIILLICLE